MDVLTVHNGNCVNGNWCGNDNSKVLAQSDTEKNNKERIRERKNRLSENKRKNKLIADSTSNLHCSNLTFCVQIKLYYK